MIIPPTKIRKAHYLEWIILKGLLHYLRCGDITVGSHRVRRFLPLLRRILRSEWAWIHTNLKLVFGLNLRHDQRNKLAVMVFENIILSHIESLWVCQYHIRDENLEALQSAKALGRGVILCSVHLGSWEPGLRRMARLSSADNPVAIVYRHANNPLSEREFMAIRQPYGVEWIRRDETRKILKAVQEKKMVGLMTDINIREGGVTAPFLGIPAQCPSGPARLAMRFRVPIVPIVCIREAPGVALFRVGTPIEPPAYHSGEAAVVALTTEVNSIFEQYILQFPEQYNWLHARWRSRPDGSLWRADDPLETLLAARTSPHPHLAERVCKLLS